MAMSVSWPKLAARAFSKAPPGENRNAQISIDLLHGSSYGDTRGIPRTGGAAGLDRQSLRLNMPGKTQAGQRGGYGPLSDEFLENLPF